MFEELRVNFIIYFSISVSFCEFFFSSTLKGRKTPENASVDGERFQMYPD